MELIKTSLIIRVGIALIAIACDWAIKDYDTSAHLVRNKQEGSHISNSIIGRTVGVFAKWDSLFFLQIAHEGYLYEKNHAFFPMYPLLIRALGTPLSWLINKDDAFIVAALAISWVSFAVAAYYLHKLTLVVFQDRAMAERTSLLFAVNPASVFMAGVYTTSLDAALSISGVYHLYDNITLSPPAYSLSPKGRIKSSLLFACATLARSNGSLLFVFPLYFSLHKVRHSSLRQGLLQLLTVGLCGFIHALPMFCFLWYGAHIFCQTSEPSVYCEGLLPNIYSYVQAQFWQVGPFRYWQYKQIPNFNLPVPALLLSAALIYSYMNSKWGVPKSKLIEPFVYYVGINVLILVIVANVQIATRMLASVPVLYWYAVTQSARVQSIIVGVSALYALAGCMMFSNFYPWT